MQKTEVQSLGLEETEDPGRLKSMGLQKSWIQLSNFLLSLYFILWIIYINPMNTDNTKFFQFSKSKIWSYRVSNLPRAKQLARGGAEIQSTVAQSDCNM